MIDDSHGINGPYNTFFRNRADLYGIFMNSNPASNNQNIVGNEVTSNAPLQGMYTLAGNGHFTFGNNIKGTIMPNGTSPLNDTSYYKKNVPGFFNSYSVYPSIGIPNTISSGTIPAKQRQTEGTYLTDCRTNYPFVFSNQYTTLSDSFCGGTSYPFNGTTIFSSGTYSDTINTGLGYDSIVILHLAKTTIDSNITISGLTLTSAEPNATYQWIDCNSDSLINGATMQSYSPSQSGNYRVRITKGNCVQETNCTSLILSGIKKVEDFSFIVQPNPVKDFCTINLNSLSKFTATIYNILGEKVFQLFSAEQVWRYTFTTQSLRAGFYFIKIEDSKGRIATQRIVVDK